MEGGFPPGMVLLQKYRVESELGRGGMGVVLRVLHLHLGEELAIKILSPEVGGGPEVHARFLREAQSAARLRGEHVARVGDVGVLPGGAPYMVMEYLRGGDLSGELARRGALPPGEVVDYVLQACEALAEAHALGIVHRDIKPSNLFLTRRPDGSPLVKVLDFGISKVLADGPGVLTRTDAVMGTPGYMSPEQMKASKDVDARSDIWALGIVLYECLNGRRPFDAETFSATVLRAATEPPPPMDPRLPRGLQAAILRCLEKDRAGRFPSIAALAAALAPFARDARSAGIIAERTAAMLPGGNASVVQVPGYHQPPHATTLSGSAGMTRSRSASRYAIGGAVVVVAIAALSIVVLIATDSKRHGSAMSSSGTAGNVPPDANAPIAAAPADAPAAVAAVMPEDAAGQTTQPGEPSGQTAPAGKTVEAKAKAQACAEFEVGQKWQELRDCASELGAIAVKDHSVAAWADEFRQKALKETAASLAARKLRDAITEGNLREAQKQFKAIDGDSFYFQASNEAFRTAEAKAAEENRRKAQALVAKNDCAGVKRLQAQVTATSTVAVTGAVAAVAAKCVERTAAVPTSGGTGPAAGSNTDPGANPPCEMMNVDDAMTQAANQYAAGFSRAALQVVTKALLCKQDVRMYRFAATYACAARDLVSAKVYFAKVPPQFQPAIVQRCQREGLSLQGP